MLTLVVFPAMCRVTRPAKPSTSITMSGMIVRRRSVVWKLVGKRHSRGMSVKMSSWIRPIHLRSDEKKAGNLICAELGSTEGEGERGKAERGGMAGGLYGRMLHWRGGSTHREDGAHLREHLDQRQEDLATDEHDRGIVGAAGVADRGVIGVAGVADCRVIGVAGVADCRVVGVAGDGGGALGVAGVIDLQPLPVLDGLSLQLGDGGVHGLLAPAAQQDDAADDHAHDEGDGQGEGDAHLWNGEERGGRGG